MRKRFVNTNGTSNGKMFCIRALAKRVYKIKSDPPSLPHVLLLAKPRDRP